MRATIVLLIILPFRVSAQVGDFFNINNGLTDFYYGADKNIEGSPFLSEVYTIGSIVALNGTMVETVPIKYDIYGTQVIVRKDDREYAVKGAGIKEFFLIDPENGSKIIFQQFKHEHEMHFFQVIHHDERFSYLKKYEVKLVEGNRSDGYNTGKVVPFKKFVMKERYFIRTQDVFTPIDLRSKKNFTKALAAATSRSAAEVHAQLKNKSFSLKRDDEVVQVLADFFK